MCKTRGNAIIGRSRSRAMPRQDRLAMTTVAPPSCWTEQFRGARHSMRLWPLTAALVVAQLLATPGVPARAAPYTLPQQPPGTGNLVFWIDHKTNQNFVFYDPVWYRTLAMLEDMTGNGNGFGQTNKVEQPPVATSGGAFFRSGTF